ncbi:MAG TPA: hypothetical protein VKE93_07905 [Candidatus Angelobacter sp.]|nr:hypothetical protein [Candidatus Angelobacter sp.]
MNTASVLFHCLPYFLSTAYGIYTLLEVFFPSLRDANFNHWEIDVGGSYTQTLGWRKVLKPPRVIAQGYMSNRSACAMAMAVGVFFIVVGFFGIRHESGIPEVFPDFFGHLSRSD